MQHEALYLGKVHAVYWPEGGAASTACFWPYILCMYLSCVLYLLVFTQIDAKLAPENLRVTKITATSCEIQWLPAHSSYEHEILMNDETVVECIQPGCSGYTMNELSPGTLYQIQVRTRILDQLKLTAGKIHGHCLSAELEFTTAEGGMRFTLVCLSGLVNS